MKLSRLDEIISNNVGYSDKSTLEMQKVYILQDISATLAMIFDKLNGATSEEESDDCYIVPFNELKDYENLYYEHVDFPDCGYLVTFQHYMNDIKKGNAAVLSAFSGEMPVYEKDCGKKWRCWNKEPSKAKATMEPWI